MRKRNASPRSAGVICKFAVKMKSRRILHEKTERFLCGHCKSRRILHEKTPRFLRGVHTGNDITCRHVWCYVTRRVGAGGGAGCNDIVELARMFGVGESMLRTIHLVNLLTISQSRRQHFCPHG